MERIEVIKNHYSSYNENERFSSRHGAVEFITTLKYVEKYLSPGMKIIEIGAATGRYSHYFARKGYDVTAVELVEKNIEVFKENTLTGENVSVFQGDATDLSFIESEAYDVTLLLGPMYHLYTEEDQLSALSEAIRVTKRGGIIFSAYCNSDLTVYQYCFGRNMILDTIAKNKIDLRSYKCFSLPEDIFQLHRKEDIDALMSHFKVSRLHYVGTDMLTHFMRDRIDEMSDEVFDIFIDYHLSICERADMIGATNHILDIFKKE